MFDWLKHKIVKADEYDFYVIQEKIRTKWNDSETYDEFMEQRSAIATHAQDFDRTLRLVGVKKFKGKEIRDVLWTHHALADIEREEEERERKEKKKHGDSEFLDTLEKMQSTGLLRKGNDMDTLQLIKELREAEDRGRTTMMDFYEAMGGHDAEASKYKFYGGMSTDVKEGIIEAAKIWKGEDEDEGDDKDDQKMLSEGKNKPDEFNPDGNGGKQNVEVPELVNIIVKYADANATANSLLEFIGIANPKQYENIIATPKEKLLVVIAQYIEVSEPLKTWIDKMYEVIEKLKEKEAK